MADHESSPEWSKAQVLETLRRQGEDGRAVSAQVFVHETVQPNDLEGKAAEIVREAEQRGPCRVEAVIGSVSRLARSFSVSGGIEFLAEIADSKDVKAILPARIDDILPVPRNKVSR